MTTKYGLFSEPGYLSPGATYQIQGQTQKVTEFKPPNVKTTVGRVGKGHDATFDKFKPLYEKEQYRPDAEERSGGARGELPWKVPSPMKRGTGLGSFYGTLGGRLEYITQGAQETQNKASPPIRSIYTSPAKKGSYGTARTTLSQLHHPLGIVSEYSYKADPYLSQHEVATAHAKRERAQRLTETPFRPPGGCRAKIHGIGVCGEYAYRAEGESKSTVAKAPQGEVPFKPTGLPRHGLSDTIGKFPEFVPDGYATDLHKQRSSGGVGDPWKPSSSGKTDCVRSIVRMNT